MSTTSPLNVHNRLSTPYGSPVAYKGMGRNKVRMFCWDFAGSCSEDCGIRERCLYIKGLGISTLELAAAKKTNTCLAQKKYLDLVYDTIVETMEDTLTTETSMQVGLEIMPLFGQLIKFKIKEASMDEVMLSDPKGRQYINPVYKEIRETIRLIHIAMKSLGVGKAKGVVDFDFINGDPMYYERMAQDEERENSDTKPSNGTYKLNK